jgi:hypothetical protein
LIIIKKGMRVYFERISQLRAQCSGSKRLIQVLK